MEVDERETADSMSDLHTVTFAEYLSSMDFFVQCVTTGKETIAYRQMGAWITTDFTCPFCGEVFGILNPDPLDHG